LQNERGLASMKALIVEWFSRALGRLGQFGPYLTIELLLPGGSLIALLLWLYRRAHHHHKV
jgi:hypothetical protein